MSGFKRFVLNSGRVFAINTNNLVSVERRAGDYNHIVICTYAPTTKCNECSECVKISYNLFDRHEAQDFLEKLSK